MAEIAALREATETEALASLQGRPSLKLNASELAKQWGWPRSRVRRRLEAWRQSGQLPKTGRKQRPGTKPATSPRPARPAATPTIRSAGPIGRYVAAGLLGVVGIGLSALGMIETPSYSLALGAFLFCPPPPPPHSPPPSTPPPP